MEIELWVMLKPNTSNFYLLSQLLKAKGFQQKKN